MTALEPRTIQQTETPTIIQRIGKKDGTAIKDCIDTYGDLVWALARKLTASRKEAEAATEEIFNDIWWHSERPFKTELTDEKLITMIALRRLFKGFQPARQNSTISMDLPN